MIPKAFMTKVHKIVYSIKDWTMFAASVVAAVLVAGILAPVLACAVPLVLTAMVLRRMQRPKVTRSYRNPVCPTCKKNHNERS